MFRFMDEEFDDSLWSPSYGQIFDDDLLAPDVRLARESPQLVEVRPYNSEALFTAPADFGLIEIPEAWHKKFRPDSLELVPRTAGSMMKATLADEAGTEVVIKVLEEPSEHELRVLFMMQRLSGGNNVHTYYDSMVFPDKTFVLMETMPKSNLASFFSRVVVWEVPGKPYLDLEKSLPLLIDMLRGIISLEECGVVHPYLSESDIAIQDKDKRALIGSLGRACLAQPGEDFGCDCFDGDLGSAFRHAPEMVDGTPTGFSNTIWAAGMLFSRMLFNDIPTRVVVEKEAPWCLMVEANKDEVGRAHIRNVIREKFTIEEYSGYQQLDDEFQDVKELLAGMLKKNPEHRWSARGALDFAMKAARKRSIYVPQPREAPKLPHEWLDWQ